MMSKDINSKKETQKQMEERIKYFMKLQSNRNSKQKKLNRIQNFSDYSTLIDPINIQKEGSNAIFINNLTLIMNNNRIENVKNNITNGISNISNNKENDDTVRNQIINNLNIPIKKSVSIPVSKELAQFTEPSLKKKELLKISPKFTFDNEININETDAKNGKITHKHKYSEHNYTKSEFEILKTHEEVPQNQIEEIANNILICHSQNEKIKKEELDEKMKLLGTFHYLINIEKCYRELSDDLKNNGLQNVDYKLKIACIYLNIIKDENNIISDIFLQDEEDINSFLNRELCFYLTFLFFDEYIKGLNENQIREFIICYNYCYINFLYVILVIIKKVENYFKENNIKFDENSNEFNEIQKCKILIELNSDKIIVNKYEENFHTNNKIIKNIFINLLNILKDINPNITKIIQEIFNISKKSKFKTILNNYLKTNPLIKEKTEKIQKKFRSENISNNENGNKEQNGNIIKEIFLPPFLPPKSKEDKRDYCLVLDLDETLVHFFEDNSEAYVKVRMGAENFITVLSQFCEIVIFTASTKYYADIVIDGLDCKNLIDHKLYREHTYDYNGINVKDLSKLGRDLKKIIIIDNIEENYIFQPNNGLNIIDFEGDENDNELQFLLEDLLELVSTPGKNVIYELPKIRKKMLKRYNKNEEV